MTVTLHLGDCVKWAREYEGDPFHALFCDPPYHLYSPVSRSGSRPKDEVSEEKFNRFNSGGFMGKQWDGGDVAFNPETWAAFMPILYPGAFGMAFAGSRGWHRLACAIEDAGFIIHPSIFGWCYGSGFPKATRVNMRAQEDPEEVYTFDVTLAFAGHRYGLQALKPALEPIIVFQKPYDGRPIDNIALTGAGVLNVDGARIDYEEGGNLASNPSLRTHINGGNGGHIISHEDDRRVVIPNKKGRWPANFYLDEEAARRLDEQSGHLVSGKPAGIRQAKNNIYGQYAGGQPVTGFGDEGGASRFFFRVNEQIDEADPVYYMAKASRAERDAGLGDLPPRDVPYAEYREAMKETDSFVSKYPDGTPRPMNKLRNPHPTVKPISLARYLATLLLPPAEYEPRRIFVPFAGVASECIGAMQAGWDDVVGVEITEEYIPIARARVEYWRAKGVQRELL